MIDLTPLRRFQPGSPFATEVTAANLNQPIDQLERLRNFVLANGAVSGQGGQIAQVRIGVITDSGPNGEDDDTSASRYWVTFQRPDETLAAGDNLLLVDEDMPGLDGTIRASNLAEDADAHDMPTDETAYVAVFQVVYNGCPSVRHWFFVATPPAGVFAVLLASDGGANGTNTGPPTYTYTVTRITGGDAIATTASPVVGRPVGTAAAASYGLGYYAGGSFTLLIAFEIPGSGGCP